MTPSIQPPASVPPPLASGDHLTRDEFERRYHAMPESTRAELIEGIVYVASPARLTHHGRPLGLVLAWLGHYAAYTPGVEFATDATVRLDLDNEPQPDALLRVEPERGGQSSTSADGYVEGAPELVVEVAASTASYDLHAKLRAYRRNGVQEYVVWRVLDEELDWFVLEGSAFVQATTDAAGRFRSHAFPGLWLDGDALLQGDLARVLEGVAEGLRADEHRAFAARLET